MKKLVIAALLLTLTGCAQPAAVGGPAIREVAAPVKVDGQTYANGLKAYEIDGKLYVPVEPLQAAVGKNMAWDGSALNITRRRTGIVIAETRTNFKPTILAALKLLEEKAPAYYDLVLDNVAIIFPSEGRSVAYPRLGAISVDTSQPLTSIADTLAHEAEHLRVAREDPELHSNYTEDERNAYKVSLEVLKLVGGTQYEMDAITRHIENPPN